jgi:hypothetical protein
VGFTELVEEFISEYDEMDENNSVVEALLDMPHGLLVNPVVWCSLDDPVIFELTSCVW